MSLPILLPQSVVSCEILTPACILATRVRKYVKIHYDLESAVDRWDAAIRRMVGLGNEG